MKFPRQSACLTEDRIPGLKRKIMLSTGDFYEELLSSLVSCRNLVSGFAVNMYGFSSITEGLDVWVDTSPDFEVDFFTKLNVRRNFLALRLCRNAYGRIYFIGLDDLIDKK